MKKHSFAGALAAGAGLAMGGSALAQMAPPPQHDVVWGADSGMVTAPSKGSGARLLYETTVFVPDAAWLRLKFGVVDLRGSVEEGTGAYLRITSLGDGAVQELNAVTAAQWVNTSAYFNGDAVKVELIGYSGTAPSRVTIVSATAGEPAGGVVDSICGPTDDRVLSFDDRQARHSVGCTSWLISDTNHQFLTAGHCGASSGSVMSFKVPLSTASGGLVQSAPQDQYVVDSASVQGNGGLGIGNDYCYFGVFPNATTGLMPAQAYSAGWYTILPSAPPLAAGQVIRITGYGTTSSPVSPTWNQVQKTHTGPRVAPTTGVIATTISYQTDTTGGNSGSPVIWESGGGVAIGIHTHATCTATAGNNGTAIQLAALQTALNNPLSACKTGAGAVSGALYAIGDAVNNFGTCNTTTGNFARIDYGPARMEGLAYNRNTGLFYGVSYGSPGPSKLYTISPATGTSTLVASLSGFTGAINGLGYDPVANVLYGVAQATGQLWVIDTTTGAATVGGTTNAGTIIGALEYDASTQRLFGIDDSGGASKLVFFTPATGTVVPIGPLGAGIADCNGLAVMENGDLYTINAATDQLLKINPATGAATVVGATGGLFGASYGMSAVTGGSTGCYANCDHSTIVPFLNVGDYTCFLNIYAAGSSAANCDASTIPPVLNVNDFTCFMNKYAAGCATP